MPHILLVCCCEGEKIKNWMSSIRDVVLWTFKPIHEEKLEILKLLAKNKVHMESWNAQGKYPSPHHEPPTTGYKLHMKKIVKCIKNSWLSFFNLVNNNLQSDINGSSIVQLYCLNLLHLIAPMRFDKTLLTINFLHFQLDGQCQYLDSIEGQKRHVKMVI